MSYQSEENHRSLPVQSSSSEVSKNTPTYSKSSSSHQIRTPQDGPELASSSDRSNISKSSKSGSKNIQFEPPIVEYVECEMEANGEERNSTRNPSTNDTKEHHAQAKIQESFRKRNEHEKNYEEGSSEESFKLMIGDFAISISNKSTSTPSNHTIQRYDENERIGVPSESQESNASESKRQPQNEEASSHNSHGDVLSKSTNTHANEVESETTEGGRNSISTNGSSNTKTVAGSNKTPTSYHSQSRQTRSVVDENNDRSIESKEKGQEMIEQEIYSTIESQNRIAKVSDAIIKNQNS